jgi:hypothetical protein
MFAGCMSRGESGKLDVCLISYATVSLDNPMMSDYSLPAIQSQWYTPTTCDVCTATLCTDSRADFLLSGR